MKSDEEADAKLKLASARYTDAKAAADAALEDLFNAVEDAHRAGRSSDHIAEEVPFTGSYIRRKLRERGVTPNKSGPKTNG